MKKNMHVPAKQLLREYLNKENMFFDGAFGTYYGRLYETDELPELANGLYPERVRGIHEEYLRAGARIIRTNTFATNTVAMKSTFGKVEENLRQGYRLAKEAVEKYVEETETEEDGPALGRRADGRENLAFVAADIGPIPYDAEGGREAAAKEYLKICETFLEEGAEVFVFETLADLEEIREAIKLIEDKAFVIVQFCVNQFGYSNNGISAKKLIQQAELVPGIDAVGFNCGVGPGHMQQIIRSIAFTGEKFISALPNAGYPQIVKDRMIFDNRNIRYFSDKAADIAGEGVSLIGGCCGTTPEYIRAMKERLAFMKPGKISRELSGDEATVQIQNNAFFADKSGKKLIAVELAPPLGSDDETLMDAAHLLQKSGVDVLTFPDSPSGRTRADSILMAEKVQRETGICVMPHICCRDKNAIAMRSQLLGAHINGIRNFLVITGDPIPTMARGSVKSVFNFDAVGLMKIMGDMNDDQFKKEPVCYGGAINQGRRNLEVEISRVKKKMEAGATFFLTQPVSTKESAERVRRIKQETGARILCGIMPFVSLKNATFMKNEMTGIDVSEEVLSRYRADMTREEGERAGISLAREMMALTEDFADGYYFSFPFNRVSMLEKILDKKPE